VGVNKDQEESKIASGQVKTSLIMEKQIQIFGKPES